MATVENAVLLVGLDKVFCLDKVFQLEIVLIKCYSGFMQFNVTKDGRRLSPQFDLPPFLHFTLSLHHALLQCQWDVTHAQR